MTHATNLSETAWRATCILEAWQDQDLERLYEELDRADRPRDPCATGTEEEERVELLAGIAKQIRRSLNRQGTTGRARWPEAGVYLKLLEHLTEKRRS